MVAQVNFSATDLQGIYDQADAFSRALAWAEREGNLISPATVVGEFPSGCSGIVSILQFSASPGAGDVYKVPGAGFALTAQALARISASAGVRWDSVDSGRVDDGRDARYCAWKATAVYRLFDGTIIVEPASKELDLRDGSDRVGELRAQQERPRDGGGRSSDPDARLRGMRTNIVSLCETYAKNRCIRRLGVRSSYTPDDLQRPFVVARLVLTGHSADPEIRRMMAAKIADSMLGASQALYGAAPRALVAAPTRSPVAAPPRERAPIVEERPRAAAPPVDRPRGPMAPPAPRQVPPARLPEPARQAPSPAAREQRPPAARAGGFIIPGPKERGATVVQATDDTLRFWADKIGRGIRSGTARNPDREKQNLDELEAEIDRRAKEEPARGETFETDDVPY